MTYQFKNEEFPETIEFIHANRVLKTLFENGPMDEIEIALRCCISDDVCEKYLRWLSSMGLVKTISYENHDYVLFMISSKGRKISVNEWIGVGVI